MTARLFMGDCGRLLSRGCASRGTTTSRGTVLALVAWAVLLPAGASAATSCPSASPYSRAISQTSGVVGYWRLDEASGTAACDGTGVNPGTYQGGFTLGRPGAIAGDSDTAAAFNGSSGDVSVPSSTSLSVADTFSVEAWVKRGSTSGTTNQVIASKQSSAWALMFNGSNQLVLQQAGGTVVATSTTTVADTTSWHHVAATKTGTSIHLYIDGKDVTGTTARATMANNTLPLMIGQTAGSSFFSGTEDEVALYNTVLSANQVTNHYLLGLASCPVGNSAYAQNITGTGGLLGYWRLGERSGTTACDTSGQNPGTYLGGFTLGQPGAINADSDTAALFNGSSASVSVPGLPSLDAGDTFTVEGWVKRGTVGGTANQVVASKQGSAWTLLFNPSNQLVLQANGTTIVASTSTIADTAGWHHVAATKSGTAVHLYIDGREVTGTVSNQTVANSTSPLAIGQNGSAGYFNGRIDDVALYRAALTSAQITNHYTLGASPANTAPPTISGTTTDGQTLTATTGTWVGASSYAYQWKSCDTAGNNCTNIAGATSQSYTLAHGDAGTTVRVVVTASNSAGSNSATSQPTATVQAVAPANTAPPTISGTTTDGQTLTASAGSWSGTQGTYTYQWQSCDSTGANCANVAGASTPNYALGPGDVGKTLKVVVTSSNSAGSASASSQATAVVRAMPPANTTAPTISGTPADGQTLTASPGTWSGSPTYAYQWQSCDSTGSNCANLQGATAQTYAVGSGDVGTTLRVIVTGTNTGGSATAPSATTTVVRGVVPTNTTRPSITGTAADGQTLTASRGTWAGSPTSYAYQWQSCDPAGNNCANLQGATGSTYTLGSGDAGSTMRVVVTATNSAGSASATSAQTAVVQAVPPSSTTPPSISGRPVPGQTLTASPGAWSGTSPTYAYQWQRCDTAGANCANLAGATAQTYALTDTDLGATLRVVITATNSAGSASATSPSTGTVANGCTDSWTGTAGDNNWQTAGNWSTNAVPAASDQVCIPAGTTVRISAGTNQAWSVSDQGQLTISGGSLTTTNTSASASSSIQSLTMSSGTLSGAGNLNVVGSFAWSGGTMSGSGTTTVGSAVNGTIGYGTLDTRVLVNQGTLTESGLAAVLTGANGAVLDNRGTLNLNGENDSGNRGGLGYNSVGAVPVLRNSGTLQKTAGSGYTEVQFAIDNSGSVAAQSGGLYLKGGTPTGTVSTGGWLASGTGSITFAGGTYAWGSGIQLAGPINVSGATISAADVQGPTATLTLNSNGMVSLTGLVDSSVQGLAMSGGTMSGAANVNVTSLFNWSGGTMTGTGTTTVGSAVNGTINSGTLDTRTLVNQGALTQSGQAAVITGANGAVLDNRGTLNLNGQDDSGNTGGLGYKSVGAVPTLRNSGTLQKTSGSGYTEARFAIDDSGTVSAQTGQLQFYGGTPASTVSTGSWSSSGTGSITFQSGIYAWGSGIQLAGQVNVASATISAADVQGLAATLALNGSSGTLTLAGPGDSSVQGLTMSGGTLSGTANLNVTNSFNWSGGKMSGAGTTTVGSAVNGSINNATVDGRTLVNQGTLTQSNDSFGNAVAIAGSNGAVIDNRGTLNLNGANSGGVVGGLAYNNAGARPVLRNTGTVQKSAGTGLTEFQFAVDNQGTISAQSGPLYLEGGTPVGTTSTGRWSGASPGNVMFQLGSYSLGTGIQLAGSITVSGATVSATDVQGPAATLTMNGSRGTVNLSGGTSNLQGLSLAGGTLAGGGNLNIAGSFSWSGGAMSGAGTTTVGPAVNGSINNATVDGRTLVNQGTLTQSNDSFGNAVAITGSNGAVIDNRGTLNLNGVTSGGVTGGLTYNNVGGRPVLRNTGSVQKTGGGNTSLQFALDNQGTVASQPGAPSSALYLEGGTPPGSASTGTWSGSSASSLIFSHGSYTLGSSSQLTGPITVLFATVSAADVQGSTATLTLSGSSSTTNFTGGSSVLQGLLMQGGALSGAGNLTVTGSFSWSGGPMSGSGTTTLASAVNGTILGQQTLDGRTIVNQGTLTEQTDSVQNSGALLGSNGAVLDNKGTFNMNSDDIAGETGGLAYTNVGARPKLVNTGTAQKAAGTGYTDVYWNYMTDSPIVAKTGTLRFFGANLGGDGTTGGGGVGGSEQYGPGAGGSGGGGGSAEPQVCRSCAGKPVDNATGNQFETQPDLEVGGRGLGLALVRSYNSQAAVQASSPGQFGYGWAASYSDHIVADPSSGLATVYSADGSTVPFTITPDGHYLAPSRVQATLTRNADGTYTYVLPDQRTLSFDANGRLASEADRNANRTSLSYDGSGHLTTVTDPVGRTITLSYNGDGTVASATDPAGTTMNYAYTAGNLTSVTLAGAPAPRWQFGYDGAHQMTSMTDARGNTTRTAYDASHRAISQTDALNRTRAWDYSTPGETKVTNPAGDVSDELFQNGEPTQITRAFGTPQATTTKLTYDSALNLKSVTDGNNHTTNFGYDAVGNRTTVIDANGHTTTLTYDGMRDVTAITPAAGAATTLSYDGRGNAASISRTHQDATGGHVQTTGFARNVEGELTSLTTPLNQTWTYTRNAQGAVASVRSPTGDTTSFGYDADLRLTSETTPTQHTTTIARDPLGRPTIVHDPLGHDTILGYDANGNLTDKTDANANHTQLSYDTENQLTKVTRADGSSEQTGYDPDGRATSDTNGNGKTTLYGRDAAERVTSVTDPLNRTTSYGYDNAGNLATKIDPLSRTTTYSYDPANELTGIAYSDTATHGMSFGYDPVGRRTSMSDGTGNSSYGYDDLGRLLAATDAKNNTTSYAYDLGDQQTGITYPNGKTVQHAYDSSGRMQSITDWLGNTTNFAYDADSNLRSTTFPGQSGNVDQYTYDAADRLSSVTMNQGLTQLASIGYTRDNNGQVTGATPQGLPGGAESYTYDRLNRLTQAGAKTYSYDGAGNPTNNGANTFDAANQLTSSSGASYSYDAVGQRTRTTPTSGAGTSYSYDQAGRLTSAQTDGSPGSTSSYDGDGMRATKTSGSGSDTYTWDQSTGIPQLLSDSTNSYIYGPDGNPIEHIDNSGKALSYHHDQLGSTRMLTDTTGQAAASFSYGAYGTPTGSTGTARTPLGYAGQYTDTDTGLQYLRARYYEPSTQQFTSRDPLEALTKQPYAYAGSDPMNGVDPSGLCNANPFSGSFWNQGNCLSDNLNPASTNNVFYRAANYVNPAIPQTLGRGLGWGIHNPAVVDVAAAATCATPILDVACGPALAAAWAASTGSVVERGADTNWCDPGSLIAEEAQNTVLLGAGRLGKFAVDAAKAGGATAIARTIIRGGPAAAQGILDSVLHHHEK